MTANPGSADGIQPTGFHIGLSSDWAVTALSANISEFLPTTVDEALGQPLTKLLGSTAIHDVRNRMALLRGDHAIERQLNCQPTSKGGRFDFSIYRSGSGFGIDGERFDGTSFGDPTGIIEGMLARLPPADDVDALCSAVARQLRMLTGYDRVCIHLNDRLAGESARAAAEPTPAPAPPSSFMICDVEASPVTVTAQGKTMVAVRSDLRASTRAELDWLRDGNTRAAMILPLSGDAKARNYASCLHATPRHISLERRSIARLFATIAGLKIENLALRGAA